MDVPQSLDHAADVSTIQAVVLRTQMTNTLYFDLKKYLNDVIYESQPPARQLPSLFEAFVRTIQRFLLDSMFKSIEQDLSS